MKIIQNRLILIMAVLAFTASAMSAQPSDNGNLSNIESDKQTNKQDNALTKARQQLEKAFDSYQQKDFKQTREFLNNAKQWLTKSSLQSHTEKVKSEAAKLAQEIEDFYYKLSPSAELQENRLVRFWHQTTSMIKRETDQLFHGYIQLSAAEKTLKHLLDAKMHLFTAEHDLFVSHNAEDANEELSDVIDYLDKAGQVAISSIKNKVESLKKDIQSIKNARVPTAESWQQNEILLSLDAAYTNLNKAKGNATPAVKLRIDSVQNDIDELRKSIDSNQLKKDYESAMTRLKTIIHEL